MKQISDNKNLIFYNCTKRKIVLFISCMCFFMGGWTQGTTPLNDSVHSEIERIRWVSKYPSEIKIEKKSLFGRIGEFIIGKQNVVILSKPINVFAENPESFWVLDQGVGSIVYVQMEVGDIPQPLKDKYSSLVGICSAFEHEIFFTDSRANKILKMNIAKDELIEFNDTVQLLQPTGIAYSSLNNELWVVETAAHRITVFNREGEVIKRIGKRGDAPLEFNFPTFIWIDKAGFVYIVDSMNFRIQILNPEGELVYYFGQTGDATGYFARPKGIATDSFGNIYVVDGLFHSVQIFDKNGKFLFHFGQQGREDGQFWMPSGIYIDSNDYIYVADSYNARIQVFQLINGE